MVKRSKIEIFHDILMIAEHGAKKTKIVYLANLTFTRAKEYLETLQSLELIEKKSEYWVTTEKGKEFIKDFNNLKSHLAPLIASKSYIKKKRFWLEP